MYKDLFRFAQPAAAALTLLLATAASTAPAAAGPFNAPGGIATQSVPNTNFVKLKQISGFTGSMAFGVSDNAYTPVGNSFNKLAKFRLSVTCPQGYRVHKAGIRVRGGDAQNVNIELVSPGDLPVYQSGWQQTIELEPWKLNAVIAVGATALGAAGNNGPVYVSLDKKLDSRIEFYGWCVESDPLSNGAMYYDSAEDNGDLHPMTRVRYTLQVGAGIAKQPGIALQQAPLRSSPRRSAGTAAPAAKIMTLPGSCPYDCPPPAPRRRQLTK